MPELKEYPITKEYFGVPTSNSVHLPTPHDLYRLCPKTPPRGFITYPSNLPVFFIKHGRAVYWNEVAAQVKAYHELRNRGSSVRTPATFYACKNKKRTIIVIEYIPDKTAGQLFKELIPRDREDIIDRITHSLSELHRIPIPIGSHPAAIDGGYVRHIFFDELEAPRHYENVDQLQEHLNLVKSSVLLSQLICCIV